MIKKAVEDNYGIVVEGIVKISEKAYKTQEEREQYEKYMQNEDETKATTLGDIFKDQLK